MNQVFCAVTDCNALHRILCTVHAQASYHSRNSTRPALIIYYCELFNLLHSCTARAILPWSASESTSRLPECRSAHGQVGIVHAPQFRANDAASHVGRECQSRSRDRPLFFQAVNRDNQQSNSTRLLTMLDLLAVALEKE